MKLSGAAELLYGTAAVLTAFAAPLWPKIVGPTTSPPDELVYSVG